MATWPDNILLIHYTELADRAESRLQILGLIGMLMKLPVGFYDAMSLSLRESDWQKLCSWLKQNRIAYFWEQEAQYIHVLQVCEKHVLIGTGQLIEDIVFTKMHSSSKHMFDNLWLFAENYIEIEIPSERNQL